MTPPELLSTAPSVDPTPVELAEVRRALVGAVRSRASVEVGPEIADAAVGIGWLVVRDPEGAPVAAMHVATRAPAGSAPAERASAWRLSGPVVAVDGADAGPFPELRLTPSAVDIESPLAVVGHDPPDDMAMASVADAGGDVLFAVLDGPRTARGPALADTVRSVQALAASLRERGRAATVVVIPAPEYGDGRDGQLRDEIVAVYGASAGVPSMRQDRAALLAALDSEDAPVGLPGPSASAWRRFRPARSARGLVLLFTGLSGSGKSTLARAVVQAIDEVGTRRTTLLDGDVVRRMLSAGLGFSREDRDRNVLRIGYVGAEIARHGGIAVCAPIAPFEATRQAVRAMATAHGDFVLVHVSTPLEECERRDRKGLYARARAGEIPEFTGISSPYEAPREADLVVDTSAESAAAATSRVLTLLRDGGWLPNPQ